MRVLLGKFLSAKRVEGCSEKSIKYYKSTLDNVIKKYNVNNIKDYKKKVEHYLKAHQDHMAIHKLRTNKPLTQEDLKTLEYIMWEKLGTKADYEKEYGDMPVNRLVRQLVGLERSAANEAFSKFLNEAHLNSAQIKYVNLIVDYIVKNGMIEDRSVLMQEPFKTVGSITTLFKDNMDDAREILGIIERVETNSSVIA